MDIQRSKQGSKEINMIPFINVIFLMLIFFMIGGSIEKFEVIHVDLPEADSGKTLDEGHMVIILGTHDEIIVNDDLLNDPSELAPKVHELLEGNDKRIITIKADATLPATNLISIMEHIRAAGGKNLSLATTSMLP